ncbi:MAG: DoxX family protein [Clostridium sp.]|nr:DoxX family protein [Prevotella sp.]MCM1429285.1 DoxX family protein [Clostridium sp.]MCM1475682.1 DoxX family protein [Muribaculaceae bacterium]
MSNVAYKNNNGDDLLGLHLNNWTIPTLTWLMRLLAGGVFIFSGFVKSIDPWGTIFKIQDYLGAMGLEIWPNVVLLGAFILCCSEFVLGVFTIAGCFRRSTPILMAIMMAFMLPLTLWIAIANPVADCGCFGDALKISNWGTFWKNIALTIIIVWLIRYNRRCRCLVEPFAQWLALTATALYIVCIALAGYVYQPLIDFRPYPEGGSIADFDSEAQESSGTEGMIFIYEKEGVKKEFSADDELPDEASGWKFVERIEGTAPTEETSNEKKNSTESKSFNNHETQRNFRIWSEDGSEDVTEGAIPPHGKRILLMMPDLAKVSTATTWVINSLYTWAERNDIDMIAVVSGSDADINHWKDISLASYSIYTADDTQIKEVVRGNPAVVYTEDGKIIWKSTLRALQTDDFLSSETSKDPQSFKRNNHTLLLNFSLIYIAVMAVLIMISYSPAISRFFFRKRQKA